MLRVAVIAIGLFCAGNALAAEPAKPPSKQTLPVAEPVSECDRRAGDPDDPKHLGLGVAWDELVENAPMAMAACSVETYNAPIPRNHYQLGRAYDAGGRHDLAKNNYEMAAKADYAAAQYIMGQLNEHGLGVNRDEVKALEWYRKAAAQNHKLAKAKFSKPKPK